jgi:hypothetical protein
MTAPGSSRRYGAAVESIAKPLMIQQIPWLAGESGARARSARVSDTLFFVNIPGISFEIHLLISVTRGRVNISVKITYVALSITPPARSELEISDSDRSVIDSADLLGSLVRTDGHPDAKGD